MFGREHSRVNCIMRTLYARHVDEPRRAANEGAAGKDELWHRLPAAFGDRPCAKRNPLPACKQRRDHRMRLKTLKFIEWGERRIPIVQVNHETNGDEAVFEMIASQRDWTLTQLAPRQNSSVDLLRSSNTFCRRD